MIKIKMDIFYKRIKIIEKAKRSAIGIGAY